MKHPFDESDDMSLFNNFAGLSDALGVEVVSGSIPLEQLYSEGERGDDGNYGFFEDDGEDAGDGADHLADMLPEPPSRAHPGASRPQTSPRDLSQKLLSQMVEKKTRSENFQDIAQNIQKKYFGSRRA